MAAALTSSGLSFPWNHPHPPPRAARGHVCRRCSYQAFTCSQQQQTLRRIHSSGLIACLRANSAEVAAKAAEAAIRGGVSVLEIVVSTPGVFEVLQYLLREHPTVILGVGTILNVEDATSAINSGAKFLMSPATVKDILEYVKGGEVLYIPGVMTPTEILSAYEAGAKIVKVYPVSALAGVKYISALKKPFQHIPMVASQGITIDSIGDYILQGASAVVLSDAIFDKEAMKQDNFDAISHLASLAVSRSREAIEQRQRCVSNSVYPTELETLSASLVPKCSKW